jgi:[protein-PII] uridylyltransferase
MLADRPAHSTEPLVAIEPQSVRGTTGVLVYGLPGRYGFARATAVLDQLGLTIVDARITPMDDGLSLDFYHVLEDDNAPITDPDRQQEIEQSLWHSVRRPEDAQVAVSRRAPRQARMFNTPTQIVMSIDERNQRSVLELIAGDRPGLLCDVGKVLLEERIELHTAKIMTVGERAEDVFYITDYDHRPLTEDAAERLKNRLTQVLDRRRAA